MPDGGIVQQGSRRRRATAGRSGMESILTPTALRSYRAYEDHLKNCTRCLPGRCAAGQELVRIYLEDVAQEADGPRSSRG